MKSSVRRGFTLVELLIVIVVIGVLAAMMMLSSTEAVTSAKAADIINNMQIIRKAALQYLADYLPYINKEPNRYAPEFGIKGNTGGMEDPINNPHYIFLDYLGQIDLNGSYEKNWGAKTSRRNKARILVSQGYNMQLGKYGDRNLRWYVSYHITDDRIKAKLAGRAQLEGFLNENAPAHNGSYDFVDTDYYNGGDYILLRIR